jgi:hypothetical protein
VRALDGGVVRAYHGAIAGASAGHGRSRTRGAENGKEAHVNLVGLTQPPHDTTQMGMIHGALGYYGRALGPASVFGGSGHAFVINVHEQLCPSGPYCWDTASIRPLVRNLGLTVEELGFFHAGSSPVERAHVEARLREALDAGKPCGLCNMEYQLLLGHDDERFATATPWGCEMGFPPATLTFGSWAEMADEVHVSYFVFDACPPAPERTIVLDALRYAVDLYRRPTEHTSPPYGMGPDAYANWAAAAEEHGGSHGNWWNGRVWSECRRMAGEFCAEMAPLWPERADDLAALGGAYHEIGELLARAADRELPAGPKAELLKQAADREAAAIGDIERFLVVVGART